MGPDIKSWDGTDWEEHVQRLLKLRYGYTGYQNIPAKHQGDFGLEGFSTDGCAYQCYAAQEPLTTVQLYEKQRDKITGDIAKFVSNKNDLGTIFNGLVIKRWILIVPRYDSKKIMTHAAGKAKYVRTKHLPYVDNDFRIHLADESYFEIESQLLERNVYSKLPKIVLDADIVNHDNWCQQNIDLVDNLRVKTSRIESLDPECHDELMRSLINSHLEGQNYISKFHQQYPEIAEHILDCKRGLERTLVLQVVPGGTTALNDIRGIQRDYERRLTEQLNTLDPSTINVLSMEAIGDWLMRCPLKISSAH